MADIVLRDLNGDYQTYTGIDSVSFNTPDGGVTTYSKGGEKSKAWQALTSLIALAPFPIYTYVSAYGTFVSTNQPDIGLWLMTDDDATKILSNVAGINVFTTVNENIMMYSSGSTFMGLCYYNTVLGTAGQLSTVGYSWTITSYTSADITFSWLSCFNSALTGFVFVPSSGIPVQSVSGMSGNYDNNWNAVVRLGTSAYFVAYNNQGTNSGSSSIYYQRPLLLNANTGLATKFPNTVNTSVPKYGSVKGHFNSTLQITSDTYLICNTANSYQVSYPYSVQIINTTTGVNTIVDTTLLSGLVYPLYYRASSNTVYVKNAGLNYLTTYNVGTGAVTNFFSTSVNFDTAIYADNNYLLVSYSGSANTGFYKVRLSDNTVTYPYTTGNYGLTACFFFASGFLLGCRASYTGKLLYFETATGNITEIGTTNCYNVNYLSIASSPNSCYIYGMSGLAGLYTFTVGNTNLTTIVDTPNTVNSLLNSPKFYFLSSTSSSYPGVYCIDKQTGALTSFTGTAANYNKIVYFEVADEVYHVYITSSTVTGGPVLYVNEYGVITNPFTAASASTITNILDTYALVFYPVGAGGAWAVLDNSGTLLNSGTNTTVNLSGIVGVLTETDSAILITTTDANPSYPGIVRIDKTTKAVTKLYSYGSKWTKVTDTFAGMLLTSLQLSSSASSSGVLYLSSNLTVCTQKYNIGYDWTESAEITSSTIRLARPGGIVNNTVVKSLLWDEATLAITEEASI